MTIVGGPLVIGVDPGKEGGLACLWEDGLLEVRAMPVVTSDRGRDEYDVEEIRASLRVWQARHVFIERLLPMPAMRGAKQLGGVIANYNRGSSTHLFIGLCAGLSIRYTLVLPQVWQKVMLAGTSGTDTKQRSIVAAQRLFPGVSFKRTEKSKKQHDGLTDAALLAEYGRRFLQAPALARVPDIEDTVEP